MSAGTVAVRVGEFRVLASGIAILEGHESLMVDSGEGISLALRWSRNDDNVITGGTITALTADLPLAQRSADVVHVFAIIEGSRRVEARFHVDWVYEWTRRVSYTLVTNF